MDNEFEFHNVGQGLFHTGHLGGFRFVFDCGTGSGSKSYITDAISNYKNQLKGNYIDLLIISHFHDDHINKIDELLDGLKIDTVVIPYFRIVERLFFAFKNPTKNSLTYRFLADPVRFLLERGIQNVVIISKGGPSFSEEVPTNPPDQEDPENINLDSMNRDESLKEYFESKDPDLGDLVGESLFPFKHNGFIVIENIWFFRFYNYFNSSNEKPLRTLKYCLEEKGIDTNDKEEMVELIKNAARREKLKGCYEEVKNDLNDTSLMAYHGPLNSVEAKSKYFVKIKIEKPPFLITFQFGSLDQSGHLLMGDASVKKQKEFKDFKRHFSQQLDSVITTLLPHDRVDFRV